LLLLRFLRTGGVAMLRMMDMPADHMAPNAEPAAHHMGPP
jgi:hypothetical protein